MGFSSFLSLLWLSWSFFIVGTHQLQSSQRQVLLQLRKHLEYPKQLEIWNNQTLDLCSIPSSTQVRIACQNGFVTELKILGDRTVRVSPFDGFAVPNHTISGNFSMDSFVATLARLTSLRVLSLVSLGMWGPLPSKIHRLYLLDVLDLSHNSLFGSIPSKISAMARLQNLTLDGNFFNGTVPDGLDALSKMTCLSLRNNRLIGPLPDLRGLSNLHMLNLSGNKINSQLPYMPKGVIFASLSHNFFFGMIPKQFGQLGQLQHLDLSFNSLVGPPPAGVFSLRNISYLNLASNMLRGPLPYQLSCGTNLWFVDISNNRLTGALPPCLSTALNKGDAKFGGNCLAMTLQHQHPESYCLENLVKKKHHKGKSLGILIGVIGGIFVVALLLGYGFLKMCRKYCPRGTSEQHLLQKAIQESSATRISVELLMNARFLSEASKLGTEGLPTCRSFSLEELKAATLDFDKSTCISEGTNGKLFKGRLENGAQVVIRWLPLLKRDTIRNLKLRLELLAKLRNPHLVCLLGHCIDVSGQDDFTGTRVLLVYEYVSNGDFRTHLSESNPENVLKWPERLAILIGVAKAVHFLHTGIIPGFFNNRLKTNDILLNEHRMAKLSDYGLSIIMGDIDNKHEVKGEGLKSWSMRNLEDDVYNFGLILLESLVGPSVVARRGGFLLNEMSSFNSQDGWRRMVDPVVLKTSSYESLSIVISVTGKCVSPDLSRLSFEDILWNLKYAAQVQATSSAT